MVQWLLLLCVELSEIWLLVNENKQVIILFIFFYVNSVNKKLKIKYYMIYMTYLQ